MDAWLSPTCRNLLAHMSDYLDETLDAAQEARIQQHLATCAYCRAMVETTRITIVLYRAAPMVAMPREVHARLVRALALEQPAKR